MFAPIIKFVKSITLRLWSWLASVATLLIGGAIVQNYENWAERRGLSDISNTGVPPESWSLAVALTDLIGQHVLPVARFICGPFGWGFVLAATLFSIPDIPKVRRWFAARRAALLRPKRDPAKDEGLAAQCDELARECVEMEAEIRGIAMKYHWAPESEDNWRTARQEEAAAMERFSRKAKPKLIKIVNDLTDRGIVVDTWDMDMHSHYSLTSIASILHSAATILRRGNYTSGSLQGNVLRATRF